MYTWSLKISLDSFLQNIYIFYETKERLQYMKHIETVGKSSVFPRGRNHHTIYRYVRIMQAK